MVRRCVVLLVGICMTLSACGGSGSSATDTPQPAAPTKAVQGNASTSPSSGQRLRLQLATLVAGTPDQGWVTYKVGVAVVNMGAASLYLNTATGTGGPPVQFGLPVVTIQTDVVRIETQEGKQYTGNLSLGQSGDLYALPPQMGVTGTEKEPFAITFKVPELLHATQIVVPSVSLRGSLLGPLTLGLTGAPSAPQTVNTAFPTNSLPATLSVGAIDLTVGPTVSGIVEPVYWLPDTGSIWLKTGSTYLTIEFTAKNTDITADQALDFSAVLIDDAGLMYSTGRGTEKQTCSPSQKLGPGQALHGNLCFTLPGSYAVKKGGLALSITGPSIDKAYNVKLAQLDNCVASQVLPNEVGFNGYSYPVTSEQTFTVPGQISGSLKHDEYHRLRFDGVEGKIIDIAIAPVLQSRNAVWVLQLFDPSGRNVFNTYSPRSPDNGPDLTNIPLLCGGTYSLYLHPSNTDTSYTVAVSLK